MENIHGEDAVMEGGWQDMTPEILDMISDQLPLPEYLSFRAVCRSWRLACVRRANITKFPRHGPWLITHDLVGGKEEVKERCLVYCWSECSTFRLPGLSDATCMTSKQGWLLAHRADHQIFFYDPFSLETINLPKLPSSEFSSQAATFAFPRTSPDCTVFIVPRTKSKILELSSCRVGDSEWSKREISSRADKPGEIQFVKWYKRHVLVCCFASGFAYTHDLNKTVEFEVARPISEHDNWMTPDTVDFVHGDLLQKLGGRKITISWCPQEESLAEGMIAYAQSSCLGYDSRSDPRQLESSLDRSPVLS